MKKIFFNISTCQCFQSFIKNIKIYKKNYWKNPTMKNILKISKWLLYFCLDFLQTFNTIQYVNFIIDWLKFKENGHVKWCKDCIFPQCKSNIKNAKRHQNLWSKLIKILEKNTLYFVKTKKNITGFRKGERIGIAKLKIL